ncbi:unnamed protein product, partial [marine sediment metagenome]
AGIRPSSTIDYFVVILCPPTAGLVEPLRIDIDN